MRAGLSIWKKRFARIKYFFEYFFNEFEIRSMMLWPDKKVCEKRV